MTYLHKKISNDVTSHLLCLSDLWKLIDSMAGILNVVRPEINHINTKYYEVFNEIFKLFVDKRHVIHSMVMSMTKVEMGIMKLYQRF